MNPVTCRKDKRVYLLEFSKYTILYFIPVYLIFNVVYSLYLNFIGSRSLKVDIIVILVSVFIGFAKSVVLVKRLGYQDGYLIEFNMNIQKSYKLQDYYYLMEENEGLKYLILFEKNNTHSKAYIDINNYEEAGLNKILSIVEKKCSKFTKSHKRSNERNYEGSFSKEVSPSKLSNFSIKILIKVILLLLSLYFIILEIGILKRWMGIFVILQFFIIYKYNFIKMYPKLILLKIKGDRLLIKDDKEIEYANSMENVARIYMSEIYLPDNLPREIIIEELDGSRIRYSFGKSNSKKSMEDYNTILKGLNDRLKDDLIYPYRESDDFYNNSGM